MRVKTVLLVLTLLLSCSAQAQTLTVAGGRTYGAATKHDALRLEGTIPWKSELWRGDYWLLSLDHAFALAWFTDENDVWAISWAPAFMLAPSDRSGFYPYLQFGIGVAVLSDDRFESRDENPYDDGSSDMGSHAQFENSIALGLARDALGIRVKVYHLSNAGLQEPNGGMDVWEVGVSYSF